MKRWSFLFTILTVAALVLSACATGGEDGEGTTVPVETPGVVTTPGAGDPGLEPTPTLEIIDEVTPTDVSELPPTEPASAGAGDLTTTPEAGVVGDVTGTPQAEVPVTGADVCNPTRLSQILDFDVIDQNNAFVGEVEAVVFLRDAVGTETTVTGDDVLDGNDDADDAGVGDITATPAVESTPAEGAATQTPLGQSTQPVLAYIVVDMDDASELGDKDVLVPFSALTFKDPAAVATEAVEAAATAAPGDVPPVADGTPVANETPGAEDLAMTASPVQNQNAANQPGVATCAFSTQLDPDTLSQAPAFDDDAWDDLDEPQNFTDYRDFWSGMGLTIPTTAENGAELGNPVVFEDDFDDIDAENTNGDDLGEVEDFIIDPETGQVQYAVLAAGGFLGIGERFIPVPMNMIVWGEFDDDADDLGEMTINVPADAWENAPSFSGATEFDTTVEGWDTDIQTFWNDLTGQDDQ